MGGSDPFAGYMNFFATRAAAEPWAAAHAEVTGGILDQDRALRAGASGAAGG